GHADLHTLDMMAIPEGFQERIGEAEEEQVVHRPLAQVMVDAEDRLLVEGAKQGTVERLRREEIVTERFFNDDASAVCASSFAQLFYNHPEQPGRDGEIVRWPLRRAQLLPEGLKRRRGLIVAVNIAQQTTQFCDRGGIDPAVLLNAVMRSRPELIEIPASFGHADDRHIEVSALDHRLQGRKNLLISQIPGRTEKNQSIRMGIVHNFLLRRRIFPDERRTHSEAASAVDR